MTGRGRPYAGLDRFEARKRVVADLEAQGLLDKDRRSSRCRSAAASGARRRSSRWSRRSGS